MDNDDMKREVLGKVYHADGDSSMSQPQDSQKSRIDELKEQLKAILMHVKKTSRVTNQA